MFRKFVAASSSLACAFALSVSNDDGELTISPETGAQLACHLFTDDFTLFDLQGIDSDSYYSASGNIEFQFCSYIEGTEYFARIVESDGTTLTATNIAITDDSYIPELVESITEESDSGETSIIGVRLTRDSDTPCPANSEINYSFVSEVLCDESITGEPQIVTSEVESQTCVVTVTTKHQSGCYQWTASSYVRWIADHPLVLGVIGVIFGLLIAICGMRWFPFISATISALTLIELVCIFSASQGWMESVYGAVVTILVGILLAIPIGILVRKQTWIAVGFNGVIWGFFVGGLVYCLILATIGWNSFVGAILISVIFAAIGCLLAFTHGQAMVLYGTSFIGSYIFMRSCTLIFDRQWEGFPSEHEILANLLAGESVSDDFVAWQFWVYIVVLLITFYCTSKWQKEHETEHEDLQQLGDNYTRAPKNQEDVDNYNPNTVN